MENWNHEVGIEENVTLLPYDKRLEFPRHKLKLGKFFQQTSKSFILK